MSKKTKSRRRGKRRSTGNILASLERIGLEHQEIRLLGGFLGLTARQQELVLNLVSAFVLDNVSNAQARVARR